MARARQDRTISNLQNDLATGAFCLAALVGFAHLLQWIDAVDDRAEPAFPDPAREAVQICRGWHPDKEIGAAGLDLRLPRDKELDALCGYQRDVNATWCQAFASLLAEVGFTGDYMRSTGMGFADVKHEIEYKAEQRAGDRIAITGGFSKLGSSSAEVRLRMRNPDTGETAAVSRITSVHFNLTERRSEPMPEEAREKIAGRMIEPDE